MNETSTEARSVIVERETIPEIWRARRATGSVAMKNDLRVGHFNLRGDWVSELCAMQGTLVLTI